MPAPFVSRVLSASIGIVCSSVLAVTVLTAPTAPAGAVERSVGSGNPTGTAAGSQRNGTSYLKLGLQTTSDGQILVSWRRPAPPSTLRRFVVKVGVNRSMNAQVRSYAVDRRKQSFVVPLAFGVTRASGNFSFVKIYVQRRNGTTGSSPTKWIQAPLAAGCPSGPDRVTVGTFNVRTWGGKQDGVPQRFDWNLRKDRVVHEILRSGAHAVAVQEASGKPSSRYGRLRQNRWIIAHLNAADARAHWTDARSDDAYDGEGLVGTRVLYDANAFRMLDSGLTRVRDPQVPSAYAPWARLQAVDGSSSPFVLMSTHLTNGNGWKFVSARNREIAQVITLAKQLRDRFGGQVVLGGDLNSTVDTKPYNSVQLALLRAGFYDAFATARLGSSKYPTTNNFQFPVRPSPHRRDYILTLGATQGSCRYVNMAYTKASQVASDHFMQVATLPLAG